MLPTDRDARNKLPIWDGCLTYFPDCWAEIAKVSAAGNKQHGLGGKLRWERGVSTDHENKVIRHMLDHQAGRVFDSDGTYHLAKAAWRILAALQLAIEANQLPAEAKAFLDSRDPCPELGGVADLEREPTMREALASRGWTMTLLTDPDEVGELTHGNRTSEERGYAPGLGQEAQRAHHPSRHPQGGEKGSAGGEAR